MFFSFMHILNCLTRPIFEAFTMMLWFDTLCGKKLTKKSMMIGILSLYFVNIFNNGIVSLLVKTNFGSSMSIIILCILGFRQRFSGERRAAIVLYAIISSILTFWLTNFQMGLTVDIDLSLQERSVIDFCANVLAISAVLALRHFKFTWLSNDFLQRHVTQLNMLLTISIIFRLLGNYQSYRFVTGHFVVSVWRDIFWLGVVITIVLIPIINYHYEQLINRLHQKEHALTASESYMNHLEQKFSDYRFFKHDYKNILASLEYGIQSGNLQDIKKTYYTVLEHSTASLPKASTLELNKLTDIHLKGLLLVKFQKAKKHDIELLLNIEDGFYLGQFENDFDFYRVIGILLDNAIENASEESDKVVHVIFSQSNHEIIIINSCYSNRDIRKCQNIGYSSKRNHTGLGLSFVSRYVENNQLIEQIAIIEDNKFIQKLILEIAS